MLGYITGSLLFFKKEDCGDCDVFVPGAKPNAELSEENVEVINFLGRDVSGLKIDYRPMSDSVLKKLDLCDIEAFPVDFRFSWKSYLYLNLMRDKSFIGDVYGSFDFFGNRGKVKALLNDTMARQDCNFNLIPWNGGYCSRSLYPVALNLFALQNGRMMFTEEQLVAALKIKKMEMPISYVKELARMIRELDKR